MISKRELGYDKARTIQDQVEENPELGRLYTGRVIIRGDLNEEVIGPNDQKHADVIPELTLRGRIHTSMDLRFSEDKTAPQQEEVRRLHEGNKWRFKRKATIFDPEELEP